MSNNGHDEDKSLAAEVIQAFSGTEVVDTSTSSDPNASIAVFDEDLKYKVTGKDLPDRNLKNWLHSYLAITQNQESPDIFHFWCGISTLASAMRRNVWMESSGDGNEGMFRTYPNLYVLLIATSAECAKSTAVNWADDILSEVPQVSIMRDKMTPEGLLSKMSAKISREAMALEGKVKKDGSVSIIAEELRVLFSQVSYVSGLTEVLTALYGCRKTFPYTTRHKPIEVHNTCVNILGASTPEWLAYGMPGHDSSGGFLGRFIFTVAHEPKRKIAWPTMNKGDRAKKEALITDLKHIAKLRGPMGVSPEAKKYYAEWYENFKKPSDPRLVEYYKRKKTTVQKLATIFAISTSNDMIVKPVHYKTALSTLENVEHDMIDAFSYLGSTQESILARQIQQILQRNGRTTRANLLRSIRYKLKGTKDLDNALAMLMQEEKVTKELLNTGKPSDKNEDGSPRTAYRITTAEEKRRLAEERIKKSKILNNLFDEEGAWVDKIL